MQKKYLLYVISVLFFSVTANAAVNNNGEPVQGGQTPEQFQLQKKNCPDCVRVAEDIVRIRRQYCSQEATVDDTLLHDPLYAYLNSMRLLARGGYFSPDYDLAVKTAEATADCKDAEKWTDKIQEIRRRSLGKNVYLNKQTDDAEEERKQRRWQK